MMTSFIADQAVAAARRAAAKHGVGHAETVHHATAALMALAEARNARSSILDPFGPVYPNLGNAVAAWRRKAKHGLSQLEASDRASYGAAVLKAIVALQRSALARETPSHKPQCASGTAHNSGADILAAIRRRHVAECARVAATSFQRSDTQWAVAYEAAMDAKRVRLAA